MAKIHPRDDELLRYYLRNKIRGAPCSPHVPEVDVYGHIEPWDIWDEYGGENLKKGEYLYFFTKLKKVNGKGCCAARIWRGRWSGQGSGDVRDHSNKKWVLGFWKRFSYVNAESDQSGCWVIHEYSLHPSLLMNNCDDGQYVICRIRKKDKMRKAAAEDHGNNAIIRSFKKLKLESSAGLNEERTATYVDDSHSTQEVLTESNLGFVMTIETGGQSGIENIESNVFNEHRIDDNDDDDDDGDEDDEEDDDAGQ